MKDKHEDCITKWQGDAIVRREVEAAQERILKPYSTQPPIKKKVKWKFFFDLYKPYHFQKIFKTIFFAIMRIIFQDSYLRIWRLCKFCKTLTFFNAFRVASNIS